MGEREIADLQRRIRGERLEIWMEGVGRRDDLVGGIGAERLQI